MTLPINNLYSVEAGRQPLGGDDDSDGSGSDDGDRGGSDGGIGGSKQP
jgi:hypothetical protein